MLFKKLQLLTLLFLGSFLFSSAQNPPAVANEAIAKMIASYKSDVRGPYKDIRWFCKDGTTVSPQERCPEPGVQRARYKDEVISLANSNHVYLGQILSTTSIEDFWDNSYNQSRLKQYQLEQFLRANDNGWINQKAQFYRGAFQAEDEEAWGIGFLQWALEDKTRVGSNYFLIRQAAKDLPHAGDDNTAQNVRALSKEISDAYTGFMDLRVKIHGQPEASDVSRVREFLSTNEARLSTELQTKFNLLIAEMETLYRPVTVKEFTIYLEKLPKGSISRNLLEDFVQKIEPLELPGEKARLIAKTALDLRKELKNPMKSSARLAIVDASLKMETLLIRQATEWNPITLEELLIKCQTLGQAASAFGYLELWEWQKLQGQIEFGGETEITLQELSDKVDHLRRAVEWGAGMFRATYDEVVKRFAFEPLANGFVDDQVRASVLLQLGGTVSKLGDFFSNQAGFSNQLMNISNQSAARGLNPGYAMGELVVTNQSPEEIEVSSDKIYVFNRPPADLKPVAGIATVTEGNMVSHVQLLARNLGIPNAVLSADNLNDLLPYSGQQVFYAISNKGSVILKPAGEMTPEEIALFEKKQRKEEMITVPVEMMELNDASVLNLSNVNASMSGKVCGPKAANLGQLKQLFPDHVVNGIVIPFAIFRQHFDQPMTGQGMSYWSFLKNTFSTANAMQSQSKSNVEIEQYVLGQLSILRNAIKQMPLLPAFEAELKNKFKAAFGAELGKVPVFIRSDTNMEDLKDFTGAGLNLTLFNVLDDQQILLGIKDVWASPYTERSYKWRQKYLLNPENVFPSILIIPSVNADNSGVLITKGVTTGSLKDLTVAFNRGVGGAVEGQASESWLLKASGADILLSPAREPEFTAIPSTGGTLKKHTTFEEQILNTSNRQSLRKVAQSMKELLPETGLVEPYDVELGFKDNKLWLFQVRPFVENKRAAASEYLRSITPTLPGANIISMDTQL